MGSTVFSWISVSMAAIGRNAYIDVGNPWLPVRKLIYTPCSFHILVQVRQVKLVGELYNYRLVDSVLIFDSLYQCPGSQSQRLSNV